MIIANSDLLHRGMSETRLPIIAILGAGPIGIEAAIYARYLGYPVTVYERGDLCDHVCQWGSVQMFTPFGMNCSPLGIAAITAHDTNYSPPQDNQLVTGDQWVTRYFEPLSKTDLLNGAIRLGAQVEFVGRQGQTKTDNVGQLRRADSPFQLAITERGSTRFETAEIVLDATGTFGHANWIGSSGMPAMGERTLRERRLNGGRNDTWSARSDSNLFEFGIPSPDTLANLNGDRFIVIGNGYSAATNIVNLADIRNSNPSVTCTWLTRRQRSDNGPISRLDQDPLEYRDALAERANQIALTSDWLNWRPDSRIVSINLSEAGFELYLDDNDEVVVGDHLLANVGFRGDFDMLEPLQLHRCYGTGGPMRWAVSISESTGDCLKQKCAGPEVLITTEPNFFILGSKTYARDPRFLYSVGLEQIRDVFTLIHGRETLDLYSTFKSRCLQSANQVGPV